MGLPRRHKLSWCLSSASSGLFQWPSRWLFCSASLWCRSADPDTLKIPQTHLRFQSLQPAGDGEVRLDDWLGICTSHASNEWLTDWLDICTSHASNKRLTDWLDICTSHASNKRLTDWLRNFTSHVGNKCSFQGIRPVIHFLAEIWWFSSQITVKLMLLYNQKQHIFILYYYFKGNIY